MVCLDQNARAAQYNDIVTSPVNSCMEGDLDHRKGATVSACVCALLFFSPAEVGKSFFVGRK